MPVRPGVLSHLVTYSFMINSCYLSHSRLHRGFQTTVTWIQDVTLYKGPSRTEEEIINSQRIKEKRGKNYKFFLGVRENFTDEVLFEEELT